MEINNNIYINNSISVLGSTGSIGAQALDVCRRLGVKIAGLSAGYNSELLNRQAAEFKPFKSRLFAESGLAGVLEIAELEECAAVLNSIGGAAGIRASFAAAGAGKKLLLANKETIVAAGDLLNAEDAEIFPVDSEHSAVFQCLGNSLDAKGRGASKIILTASGGAFRDLTIEEMKGVTARDALRHPTWKMGKKVTIDSATLMNKGFEVIEAASLFGVPYDDIEVFIHPQSAVHSMVEFKDGAVMAQLAVPDMRLPIQHAVACALGRGAGRETADFGRLGFKGLTLNFEAVDDGRFPCFKLAIEAGRRGGGYGAVLVGADEAAVDLFIKGAIGFLDVAPVIESALAAYNDDKAGGLEGRLAAAEWGERFVRKIIRKKFGELRD